MADVLKLDGDVMDALSSETRRDIIREVSDRGKTVTQLSESLDMSKSSIHEHVSKLVEAGILRKRDRGDKWKYYELSEKGEGLLNNKGDVEIVLLGLSALAVLAGSIYQLYDGVVSFFTSYQARPSARVESLGSVGEGAGVESVFHELNLFSIFLGVILLLAGFYMIYLLYDEVVR